MGGKPSASDITVLTSAIPKRLGMLAECMESVRNQTLRPHAHYVHIDYEKSGTVKALNRMFWWVETEFVALLADDDLMYPEHLEKLRGAIGDHAVAYSWCECGGQIPHVDNDSVIAANVLIRSSEIVKAGGWVLDSHGSNSCEDFRMWDSIRDQGGTFVCVPEITWEYRFHGDNQSRTGIKGIF